MKNRNRLVTLSLAIVFAFAFPNGYATTKDNRFTFTLGAGYDYFAGKRKITNSDVPLAIAGYQFNKNWGIEGLLGIINSTSRQSTTNGKAVHGALFLLDGIYFFSHYSTIEPFVLAGVGIQGLSPNGNDARNEGNINAGAGLAWFVSPTVALRVEARDVYTAVGGKNDVMVDGGLTVFC